MSLKPDNRPTIPYRIYSGAGNTFAIIDATRESLPAAPEQIPAFVESIAGKDNLATDGVIFLTPSQSARFEMRFYNPDGSFGALCGNGSRCAVQAAKDLGIISEANLEFSVLGSTNRAEILRPEWIRVYFQDPGKMKFGFKIRVAQKDFLTTNYVDLGSQHAITFADQLHIFEHATLEDFHLRDHAPVVRWHPDFRPRGVNANFAEISHDENGEYIRIRTFERGVEGETLACGTGCMSTAIAAKMTGRITSLPVRLKTQSGEFVIVNFEQVGDRVTNLSLEGSANFIREGALEYRL